MHRHSKTCGTTHRQATGNNNKLTRHPSSSPSCLSIFLSLSLSNSLQRARARTLLRHVLQEVLGAHQGRVRAPHLGAHVLQVQRRPRSGVGERGWGGLSSERGWVAPHQGVLAIRNTRVARFAVAILRSRPRSRSSNCRTSRGFHSPGPETLASGAWGHGAGVSDGGRRGPGVGPRSGAGPGSAAGGPGACPPEGSGSRRDGKFRSARRSGPLRSPAGYWSRSVFALPRTRRRGDDESRAMPSKPFFDAPRSPKSHRVSRATPLPPLPPASLALLLEKLRPGQPAQRRQVPGPLEHRHQSRIQRRGRRRRRAQSLMQTVTSAHASYPSFWFPCFHFILTRSSMSFSLSASGSNYALSRLQLALSTCLLPSSILTDAS